VLQFMVEDRRALVWQEIALERDAHLALASADVRE
jgi:hypothetical protein